MCILSFVVSVAVACKCFSSVKPGPILRINSEDVELTASSNPNAYESTNVEVPEELNITSL